MWLNFLGSLEFRVIYDVCNTVMYGVSYSFSCLSHPEAMESNFDSFPHCCHSKFMIILWLARSAVNAKRISAEHKKYSRNINGNMCMNMEIEEIFHPFESLKWAWKTSEWKYGWITMKIAPLTNHNQYLYRTSSFLSSRYYVIPEFIIREN